MSAGTINRNSLSRYLHTYLSSPSPSTYPPAELTPYLLPLYHTLYTRSTRRAGLELVTRVTIPANTPIGVYGGTLHQSKQSTLAQTYLFELTPPGRSWIVDGDPALGPHAIFGRMNESFTSDCNVQVDRLGIVTTRTRILKGTPLTLHYSESYDWSNLQSMVIQHLGATLLTLSEHPEVCKTYPCTVQLRDLATQLSSVSALTVSLSPQQPSSPTDIAVSLVKGILRDHQHVAQPAFRDGMDSFNHWICRLLTCRPMQDAFFYRTWQDDFDIRSLGITVLPPAIGQRRSPRATARPVYGDHAPLRPLTPHNTPEFNPLDSTLPNQPAQAHTAARQTERLPDPSPPLQDPTPIPPSRMHNDIRCISWNCGGLTSGGKLDSCATSKLRFVLAQISLRHIDVCFLQDTRLHHEAMAALRHSLRTSPLEHTHQLLLTPTDGVGGQLVIYSHRLQKVSLTELVPLGAVTALTAKLGEAKLLLISTYWPCNRTPGDSLHGRLRTHPTVPEDVLVHDFVKMTIREAATTGIAQGRSIIICGDMNSDIRGTGRDRYGLREWFGTVPTLQHSSTEPDTPTYHGANTSTTIDHFFHAGPLHRLCCRPLMDHRTEVDHRMVFSHYRSPGSQVRMSRPRPLHLFRDIPLHQGPVQDAMIAAMAAIEPDMSLDPEDIIVTVQNAVVQAVATTCPVQAARTRTHWSPTMMALNLALEYNTKILRGLTTAGRQRWDPAECQLKHDQLLHSWEKRLRHLGKRHADKLPDLMGQGVPSGPAPATLSYTYHAALPAMGHDLPDIIRQGLPKIKHQLHAKARKRLATDISAKVKERQKLAEAGKLRKPLDSLLNRTTDRLSCTTLCVDGITLTDPWAISELRY